MTTDSYMQLERFITFYLEQKYDVSANFVVYYKFNYLSVKLVDCKRRKYNM